MRVLRDARHLRSAQFTRRAGFGRAYCATAIKAYPRRRRLRPRSRQPSRRRRRPPPEPCVFRTPASAACVCSALQVALRCVLRICVPRNPALDSMPFVIHASCPFRLCVFSGFGRCTIAIESEEATPTPFAGAVPPPAAASAAPPAAASADSPPQKAAASCVFRTRASAA